MSSTSNFRTIAIAALVACHCSATLGIVAADELMGPRARMRTVPPPLYFALFTSQFSLTVVWLSLGRRRFSLRLAAVIATTLVWSWLRNRSAEQSYGETFAAYSVVVAILATPLLLMQLTGIRLAIPRQGEQPTAQFSLSEIFGWLVVVAIVLTTARYFESWISIRYSAMSCAPIAITCLAVTWAMFSPRRFLRHLTVAVIVSLLSVVVSMHLNYVTIPPAIWGILQRTAVEICILTASLWLFRALGYRLVSA